MSGSGSSGTNRKAAGAGPAAGANERAAPTRVASSPASGGGAAVGDALDVLKAGQMRALVTGACRGAYAPRRSDIVRLQRTAGNRAATGLVVQRIIQSKRQAAEAELGEDFNSKSDADKVVVIRDMVAKGKSGAMLVGWSRLGDPLGQARANADLFTQSVALDDSVLDLPVFAKLRETFKKDVEALALSNLAANRALLEQEMQKTGVAGLPNGEEPSTKQDEGVQDVQKLVPRMEAVKEGKSKLRGTIVGYSHHGLDRGLGEPKRRLKHFDPASEPDESAPNYPEWSEVNKQWARTQLLEAQLIRESPSAAYFLSDKGPGLTALKDKNDIKAARAAIATALNDMAAKIDKAVPLIGTSLTFTDMPPMQQQLLIGVPGASGTNWSKPVEKALAAEETADANITNLLTTLGLASVSAAFFICASIATAGGAAALGTFLFAGGAIASGTQAGMSWSKYADLSTAQQATTDPEYALVTGEQVDEALFGAIMDSVFAAIDVWQGVKGVAAGVKLMAAERGILSGGKAGAAKTARAALATLGRAGVNDAEVIGKAIVELGPEQVRKLTGMSFEQLADKVGKGSELGTRLVELGSKGISETTRALLEKLPNLVALDAKEGEQVLRAAIDTHGILGTLGSVGGWATIKKCPAMKAGTGSAAVLEGWRRGLIKELQDYIAKESKGLTQAVDTGTKKASSDVDVQIVQGAAGELQQKAEAWLSGRVGMNVEKTKNLLDAEILVDPFRSHFYDVVKGLDDAVRKDIAARMGDYERRMLAGAEIQKAGGITTEAGKKAAEDWAGKGVPEPFLNFKALTPAEQKAAAGKIDTLMEQVKTAPSERLAKLVEEISMTQAQINASHPQAYVGGGVAVWVTGREDALEDVKKLAEAVNMEPEKLLEVTKAQRIMAALNEAKWLEAAMERLRSPVVSSAEDLGKVTKDVTDIGKHGARGASQLSKAGAPNAAKLDSLFAELEMFKRMSSEEIAAAFNQGHFSAIQSEITGTLSELKTATKAAVDGLREELVKFSSTGAQMDEFQKVLLWQLRYSAMADKAIQATNNVLRLFKEALMAQIEESIQEPEPAKSEGPPAAPTS